MALTEQQNHLQQVVEQQDSQKTVDIELEDLSETMNTMDL